MARFALTIYTYSLDRVIVQFLHAKDYFRYAANLTKRGGVQRKRDMNVIVVRSHDLERKTRGTEIYQLQWKFANVIVIQ